MKNIIVAYDNERGIGVSGKLLWGRGEMATDMSHFKELTIGHAIIMDRKTLESIGIALPGRRNIIVSQSENIEMPGIEVAHSIKEAFEKTSNQDETFVIGGGSIYEQTIKEVDRIYATEVHVKIDHVDTYFPKLDNSWFVTNRSDFDADDKNIYPFSFITYDKKPSFVNLDNARHDDQREVMEKIVKNNECPFCEEHLQEYHKKEILRFGNNWLITYNQWPYKNTKLHLLAIARYHAEDVADLHDGAFDELMQHVAWAEKEFGFNSGGLCMRFGDVLKTGASVNHLHAHIIVPEENLSSDKKVRFKIS